MKKTLITFAVLLVSAQTYAITPKQVVEKIGIYPVGFQNRTGEQIKLRITPRRPLSNCPVLDYTLGPKGGLKVSVPRRCCVASVRVSGVKTRKAARFAFKGDCIRGSTSFIISKDDSGKMTIEQKGSEK